MMKTNIEVVMFAAIILIANTAHVVGANPRALDPMSLTLNFDKNQYSSENGYVTVYIERDDFGRLKEVSLTDNMTKISVPPQEFSDFIHMRLSNVKIYRNRISMIESERDMWIIEFLGEEENTRWGKIVAKRVVFVFIENVYSYFEISEQINQNTWRLWEKLPGKELVDVGRVSAMPGVFSNNKENVEASQPDQIPAEDGESPSDGQSQESMSLPPNED